MSEVRLVGVSKVFPGPVGAVRDLTLTVPDGELLVLVGPSGCGKSTTLRVIAGLEQPTEGQVYLGGQLATAWPAARRNVAMVFQSPAFYPHLTVRQNLAFGLRVRKTPRALIEQRTEEVADMLALRPLLDRWPDELSGGQQQRVALGRVVVRRPDLFLLDEPLSDLDAPWRTRLREEIADIQRQLQATMIYVTHDQAEAMTLGQRIVVLRDGVVQQVDTPSNIYHRPVNRFVAGFFGSPAMNFLPATMSQGQVRWQEHRLPIAAPSDAAAVTVGVRPEDVLLTQTQSTAICSGRVQSLEWLGHETLVRVAVGSDRLVIRCGPQAVIAPGQAVHLTLRPEGLHLFAVSQAAQRLNDRA